MSQQVPPDVASLLTFVGLSPEADEEVIGLSIFMHVQAPGSSPRAQLSQVVAPGNDKTVREQMENVYALAKKNLSELDVDAEAEVDHAIEEMLKVREDLDQPKSRLRGLFSRK